MTEAAGQVAGPPRNLIGYGRSVPRVRWPDGANVAVNIVVNYEEGSEYSFPAGDGENEHHGGEESYPYPAETRNLAQESIYEYGSRAGIWRLLDLFREHGTPVTLSACAMAFELNPEVARVAREDGHDLLSHGWRWSEHWRLSATEERDNMLRAIDSFTKTWGERPLGWYCRYGPSVRTRDLVVAEGGFLYDSDAYNDDLPYYVKVDGKDHLVIPYSLTYNDLQGTMSPIDFLEYARRAVDELWREGEAGHPKMMSLGLHPRIVGQAGRASAVREFIEHCQSKGRVWFARRIDIARWWLEHQPPE